LSGTTTPTQNKMKISKLILAGGTGFLGQAIIKTFAAESTQIIVLTRGKEKKEKNIRYLNWDGKSSGKWEEELNGADVLINLTGRSVDCRYTEKNKAEIISSRLNSTRALAKAINTVEHPPKVWLNAASATIYKASEDTLMGEDTGETGTGFSVDVCKQWENAFNEKAIPATRKIALRISMVLGKGGGVFPVLKKLTNIGLGGKMGTGRQRVSWIHEEDFLSALKWLISNENAAGPYNLAAPEPVSNSEFMSIMRRQLNRKIGLPATKWMLEIGAFFIRTETELILKSRNVIPQKLLNGGFHFTYSKVEDAIKNLAADSH
jgi:uncharacterized protein